MQWWNVLFGKAENIRKPHFMYGVPPLCVWIPACCIWEIYPIPKSTTFFLCASQPAALIVNILCVQWIPNNCQVRSWERPLFRPLSYISTKPCPNYIVTLCVLVLLIYLGIKSVMNLSVAPSPLTHFSLLPIKPRAELLVKCLSIETICILPTM